MNDTQTGTQSITTDDMLTYIEYRMRTAMSLALDTTRSENDRSRFHAQAGILGLIRDDVKEGNVSFIASLH